jgi:hypothetical protein
MRRQSVTLLIDMTRTAMDTVSSIRTAAEALEDDGDVTELIASSLEEAHTELEMMKEDLWEYRATKAED